MPTRKPYTFEQFTAIRRYGLGSMSFSPDGSQIAYTVNTSGQFNLWRQPSAGGFPHQLTVFTDRAVRQTGAGGLRVATRMRPDARRLEAGQSRSRVEAQC